MILNKNKKSHQKYPPPPKTSTYRIFYGERCKYHVQVTAKGNPGHASAFVKNTAGEKLNAFTNKVLNFRKFEESRLEKENLDLGQAFLGNGNRKRKPETEAETGNG